MLSLSWYEDVWLQGLEYNGRPKLMTHPPLLARVTHGPQRCYYYLFLINPALLKRACDARGVRTTTAAPRVVRATKIYILIKMLLNLGSSCSRSSQLSRSGPFINNPRDGPW